MKRKQTGMHMTIAELNRGISGVLHQATETGEPINVVNGKRRGAPTEAVIISAELFQAMMNLPGAKKRVREFAAEQQEQLPDVA